MLAYGIRGDFISLDNPSWYGRNPKYDKCSKFITRKDGTRVYARQLELEAICFEVSDEKHQAYLDKKKKDKSSEK